MKREYLSIAIHILVWTILTFLLITSELTWGWTIDSKVNEECSHIYGSLTNMLMFYLAAYWLVPLFFFQKKNSRFLLMSVVLLMSISLIELGFDYYIGQSLQTRKFVLAQELTSLEMFLDGLIYIIPVNFSFILFAMAYRLPIDRRKSYERELKLQKDKYSMNLELLKSQIQPHTIFNGMNGIYHLIDEKPEKAKKLLLSMSNTLRHHLYESSNQFVSLRKEMRYVKEFIAFNRYRAEDDLNVELNIDVLAKNEEIAPLLMTPFIENAFKYVSKYGGEQKNFVNISISVQHSSLLFHISNRYDNKSLAERTHGGIGLENIKRRLELLYEQNFELKIRDEIDIYSVLLKIPIRKCE